MNNSDYMMTDEEKEKTRLRTPIILTKGKTAQAALQLGMDVKDYITRFRKFDPENRTPHKFYQEWKKWHHPPY